ncbi:MAG: hypothetical protein AMS25_01790 [Gemmatimonas sp. SM23_52]|nr:MAG: hypothetical protein AMS25_01790 [Gemmatimonas sp. SM23_52]
MAFCIPLLLVSSGAGSAQEEVEPTQNPLAGSEVFRAKGCGECHAVNGLGATVGPDLGRIARRRSFHELAATLWNHIPLMADFMQERGITHPEMDAREAADLIGFLFTLDYFDAPGDVDLGKDLFTEKSCFVCHRVDVFGGEVGPNLDFLGQYGSPILVAATMWNHGAPMADSMKARGIKRPLFQPGELVDLIAYLQSVAPQPLEGPVYVLPGRAEAGRVIFVEKRCNECHSVQGVGGRLASDLAEWGRQWGLTEFAAAMWNKEPAMSGLLAGREMSMPHIGGVEMADLVAYLYSIEYFAELGDAEVGEQRLREKDCLSCHSLRGEGGSTASDLSLLRGLDSPAAVTASMWNHSVLMEVGGETAWPGLTPEEMADIAAFLQALAVDR